MATIRKIRNIAWVSLFGVTACVGAPTDSSCVGLKSNDRVELTAFVNTPGRFCIAEEFNQRRIRDTVHDGGLRGLPSIVYIAHSDVDIDISGRTMTSLAPVTAYVHAGAQKAKEWPYRDLGQVKNIRIHNGAISSIATDQGIAIRGYGDISGVWPFSVHSDVEQYGERYSRDAEYDLLFSKRFEKTLGQLRATGAHYQSRGIVLENLHIRVKRYGAVIEGGETIVRNCVIEVDQHAALFIYGPRALIENNILIVNGVGSKLEADAIIRLHGGNGSIIRNNQLVLTGASDRPAVTLVSTKDAVIENNSLYGVTELYKAFDDVSNSVVSNNQLLPFSSWQK